MNTDKLTIKAELSQFETARQFIVKKLKEVRVPDQMISENELVFEEIFLRITEQYKDEDMDISISLVKRFGEIKILVEFFGDRFNIDFHSMDKLDHGAKILGMYEDKIGLTYRKRHNFIGIVAKRTYDRIGYMCIIAMLMAVAAYTIARLIFTGETLDTAYTKFIYPIEMMFGNAMIMIASPVTFFAILTNVANCYIIADNRIKLRSLAKNILLSSVLAEALAVGYFEVIKFIVGNIAPVEKQYDLATDTFEDNFIDTLYDMIPQNIFQPFMDMSPFPMIVIAIISAAALCTMNRHFDRINEIAGAVDAFFERALSIIMTFLPIASFLAISDVLIDLGYGGILKVLMIVGVLIVGLVLMVLMVAVWVAISGINPWKFLKSWFPAAVENFKINSSIDAVPYNIRFGNKTYGISFSKLDVEIPILAQVNQTGNCFMLMISILAMMTYTGMDTDPTRLLLVAVLIIFISLGAPGQGGTMVIGLVILFSFAGISIELIAVIIYIEAIFGRLLPVVNALFDMATIVTRDKKEKRRKEKCQQ